jgi:hypothetical protein
MSQDDPLMMFRCPRCGAEYDAEQFAGDEVPRCTDWCEPFADDIATGASYGLDPVYRSDILQK